MKLKISIELLTAAGKQVDSAYHEVTLADDCLFRILLRSICALIKPYQQKAEKE